MIPFDSDAKLLETIVSQSHSFRHEGGEIILQPARCLNLTDIKDVERSLYDLLVNLSETLIDDPLTAEDNEFNRHGALAIISLCDLTTELANMRKAYEPKEPAADALPDADGEAEVLYSTTHGEYRRALMGFDDTDAE